MPGVTVALSASGSNTAFAAANGNTTAAGLYTTTVTATSMQTETLTALIGGSVNATTSVTFTGNANATRSSLTLSPNSQSAGPSNLITATLTLKDAAGNALANVAPTWGASGGNTSLVASGNTSSAKVATATFSSTLAQSESATVSAGGLNQSATMTFVAGSPNAATSYVYALPPRQLANNSNVITASVMLYDAYSNPVSGQAATFTASGANTTVSVATTTSSFTSDGSMDLVTTNYNDNSLSVLIGTGLGTFQAQITAAVGSGPRGLIASDLNGDGKIDLAVAYAGTGTGVDSVGIFLGLGTGLFQTPTNYAPHPGAVAAMSPSETSMATESKIWRLRTTT